MPVSKRKGGFPYCDGDCDCCDATETRLRWHRPRHSGSAKSFRRDGDVDVRKVANVGEGDVRIPTMYSKLRPVGSLTTAVADAIGRLSLPGSELTRYQELRQLAARDGVIGKGPYPEVSELPVPAACTVPHRKLPVHYRFHDLPCSINFTSWLFRFNVAKIISFLAGALCPPD